MSASPPSLHEWLGGAAALERLIERFYAKVPADPLLAPVFATPRWGWGEVKGPYLG